MLVVVLGLAWAGVVNLRARRAAIVANHVELIPAKAGTAADASAGMGSDLQGKPAPGFTLVSTDGRKVSLADFKGRPVVVNFWATYCGPCKLEMPWLQQFADQYRPQGLVVLGLDQDPDMGPAEVEHVARRLGVTYPLLMPDAHDQTSQAYGGVDYTPETFYIDKTGKITAVAVGASSKDQMEGMIQKALTGA